MNSTSSEKLSRSARTVIDTCMDVRRGENILIVCDSTTTEVGQALHDAASLRSDRVLLIVMPKDVITAKSHPLRLRTSCVNNRSLSHRLAIP